VLNVSGSADGLSADDFARIAEQAKSGCPVSKALAGTEIALKVG
jgi:lipoyl-dependent peroxiredoxin